MSSFGEAMSQAYGTSGMSFESVRLLPDTLWYLQFENGQMHFLEGTGGGAPASGATSAADVYLSDLGWTKATEWQSTVSQQSFGSVWIAPSPS